MPVDCFAALEAGLSSDDASFVLAEASDKVDEVKSAGGVSVLATQPDSRRPANIDATMRNRFKPDNDFAKILWIPECTRVPL